MQVLDHQHRRALLGQRLTEPPPGRERLRLPVTTQLAPAGQANQRPQVSGDPGRPPLVAEQVGDGPASVAAAASAGSVSRMPAWALTTSPSAHNATPAHRAGSGPAAR